MVCKSSFSEERLMQFFDGEASAEVEREVQTHLRACAPCAEQVRRWDGIGDGLRDDIDFGVESVEPLLALQCIRAVICRPTSAWQRVGQRLLSMPLLQGGISLFRPWSLAAGAALLLVVVPLPLLLLGIPLSSADHATAGDALAAVTIESLEFDGNSRPVVYRPADGNTTIIWVEPRSEVVLH